MSGGEGGSSRGRVVSSSYSAGQGGATSSYSAGQISCGASAKHGLPKGSTPESAAQPQPQAKQASTEIGAHPAPPSGRPVAIKVEAPTGHAGSSSGLGSRGRSGHVSTVHSGGASGLVSPKPETAPEWSDEPWARLVSVDDESKVYVLSKRVTTIGRDKNICNVVIEVTVPDGQGGNKNPLSRCHLELTYFCNHKKCNVKDMSKMGTRMQKPGNGVSQILMPTLKRQTLALSFSLALAVKYSNPTPHPALT